MEEKIKIILATSSKRRKAILDTVRLKYEAISSDAKEESSADNPGDYVKDLSKLKADAVEKRIKEKAVIIAADSITYMDGKIYEKPKSKEEAFNNMKEMSGKLTYTYTGVTIKDLYQNKEISFADACKVYIKDMTDEEIKWYVDTEKNLLNISGYAMMGGAAMFLDRIEGDYNTLFGISPSKVFEALKTLGYKISDLDFED